MVMSYLPGLIISLALLRACDHAKGVNYALALAWFSFYENQYCFGQ
jgi:hypothetical protein